MTKDARMTHVEFVRDGRIPGGMTRHNVCRLRLSSCCRHSSFRPGFDHGFGAVLPPQLSDRHICHCLPVASLDNYLLVGRPTRESLALPVQPRDQDFIVLLSIRQAEMQSRIVARTVARAGGDFSGEKHGPGPTLARRHRPRRDSGAVRSPAASASFPFSAPG